MFPRLAAELKISSKILSLAELVNEVVLSTNTDKTDYTDNIRVISVIRVQITSVVSKTNTNHTK